MADEISPANRELQRAASLERRGRLIEAEAICRGILKKRPDDAGALLLLGAVASRRGDHGLAVDSIRRAIILDPRDWSRQLRLSDALEAAGRIDEAEAACRKAIALAPSEAPAHERLGAMLLRRGHLDEALAAQREALRLAPERASAHDALGQVLAARGVLDEAEAAHRRAVALAPDDPILVEHLVLLLYRRRRIAEAVEVYREAIARRSNDARLHMRFGVALTHCGRHDEAEATLRQALTLDPALAQAHGAFGLLLLSRGRFVEGWREYEWRWRVASLPPSLRFSPSTRWRGAPIERGSLLLGAEQGLGEEILYASALPDLNQRAPSCILECNARLAALLARSFPALTVVARSDPPDSRTRAGEIVAHAPMGSALQFVRGSLADFPQRPSYLVADEARTMVLRERYRKLGAGPVVGISWRSANPEWRDFKSTALEGWRPILSVPGAVFIDLQYGDSAAERAAIRQRFGTEIFHDAEIDPLGDLDAFAAQVAALDLVISVSNTAVHVAGALGQPCWVLVPTGPGHIWYWFHEREDSPWYPSLRLLRQPRPGDWAEPIERAARDLAAWESRRRRAN